MRTRRTLTRAPHGLIRLLGCRYLRLVDKFNEQNVSAFLTAGGAKLMLLHDGRTDDAIRTFFAEVHELYVKVLFTTCLGCGMSPCLWFRDAILWCFLVAW